MVFRVEIAPQAFRDLDQIAGYIEEKEGFEPADEWFNALIDAIQTLHRMPGRSAIAHESQDLGQEVRT
jgi:plasmid stabilization system protein ParE